MQNMYNIFVKFFLSYIDIGLNRPIIYFLLYIERLKNY